MYEVGMKNDVLGMQIKNLSPLSNIWSRPTNLPYISSGKVIICGFDQGLGEKMLVCESLEDMQYAYDQYARGLALSIYWYQGEVRPAVEIIEVLGDYIHTANLVGGICPNASKEVRQEIVAYARGNFGAGKALATLALRLEWTSADQVREWVGWPLTEYSAERASEIWDRFNR
jgi:hypothetical protein